MLSVTSAQLDAWFAGLLLPLARLLGLLAAVPALGGFTVSTGLRLGLGLAVALALVPALPTAPQLPAGDWLALAALARESVVRDVFRCTGHRRRAGNRPVAGPADSSGVPRHGRPADAHRRRGPKLRLAPRGIRPADQRRMGLRRLPWHHDLFRRPAAGPAGGRSPPHRPHRPGCPESVSAPVQSPHYRLSRHPGNRPGGARALCACLRTGAAHAAGTSSG